MATEPPDKEQVFNTAAEMIDPAQRAAYLEEACGGDCQLRAEIEDLLRHDDDAGSFLERPVGGQRPTEVLDALTDPEAPPDPINSPRDEVSLDFLQPCEVPGRLGMLGPYEVIEVIGRGGMGVVLRAQDPKLNRVVAIKVLAPEFAANPTARKRFLREAQAAAAVSHPHVVGIHAVDEADNTPYLVMECIDGLSLQEKIERVGHLKLREILRIGSQIAAGLADAHSQGLIHRDIKPSNILLENGVERVRITDFGLARAVDDIGITRTGEVAGTPQYMSPEQAQGGTVDHRSDLFSLGSVLYAMCTGRSPFRAETTVAVMRRVCDDVPRPIREVNPDIPEGLVAIIERLLPKSPDERFQTAQEVADLLGWHLAGLQYPTGTPRPGPMGVAAGPLAQAALATHGSRVDKTSWPRRGLAQYRPWAAAALVLLVLCGTLGITEATGLTRLAATVIRIAAGEGTLVIETDDPAVKVSIDGEDVSISGAGVEELRLRPGKYQFRATKDGKPIKTQLVTISRGGRQVINVTMEPPAASHAALQRTPLRTWQELLGPGAPPPAVAPFDAKQARKHQEAWAKYLNVPVETTNSIGMKLVLIPPGEFDMGSTKEEQDEIIRRLHQQGAPTDYLQRPLWEGPLHRVTITHPFYLGQYEVTNRQFRQFVEETQYRTEAERDGKGAWGLNPQTGRYEAGLQYCWRNAFPGQTDQQPVVNVSWNDAVAVCQWLSRKEGKTYRLPTEADWEYACRAGTTTPYCCGNDAGLLADYAWLYEDSCGTTHAVGQKKPNSWALYDIEGNVWEWCADALARFYYHQSPRYNPTNPASRGQRVFRGASWRESRYDPLKVPCAYRCGAFPFGRDATIGFRVVCEVPKGKRSVPEKPAIHKPAPATPPLHTWKELLGPGAPPPAVAPFDAKQARKHQEAWAKYLNVPVETTNSIGMKLIVMPPGEFEMGSSEEEIEQCLSEMKESSEPKYVPILTAWIRSEGPRHHVRITKPFYLGAYEVTEQQYERVMGSNPIPITWRDSGAIYPMSNVSWNEAFEFCRKLSELPSEKARGVVYRLPAEAQWEYACRAGTTTRFSFGDDVKMLSQYAWWRGNSGGQVQPVGQLLPNAWGLYDMHGNVGERCGDGHEDGYYTKFPVDDPVGPDSAAERIMRGADGRNPAHWHRSAKRQWDHRDNRYLLTGFRVVCEVTKGDPPLSPRPDP